MSVALNEIARHCSSECEPLCRHRLARKLLTVVAACDSYDKEPHLDADWLIEEIKRAVND